MLVSSAITLIRALLNQDGANNDQLDDTTQLLPLIQLEVETLRSEIADVAPHLYEATTSPFTVPPVTVNKPADFKRVLRVERQLETSPTKFFPVRPTDGLYPDFDWLNWEERGTTLVFAPGDIPTGTYRIVYETTVAALNAGSTIPVPPGGFEGIIIQRVCGQLRAGRLKEKPQAQDHFAIASDTWKRLKGSLKRRTGEHPPSGMKRERSRR